MSSPLLNLKPELLWKHFDAIRQIPRCSRNEDAAGKYVVDFAKQHGFESKKDDTGNIVVRVPATPGKENAPVIVLQGHLDIVCEKNSDKEFNFDTDPIEVLVEGDWVTANGTTLGADNGIGLAASLAAAEDASCVHGPLELLFTTDEETGLNGANGIQPGFLQGRIMLNLDSEEEGNFSIGCAGGADSEITLSITRSSGGSGSALKISLAGLRGGHSGIDIHTGRGNAIQLLARMLYKLDVPFDLISLEGGSKHNAIPRETFAQVMTDKVEELKAAVQKQFEQIRFEYKAVEKNIKLTIDAGETSDPMNLDSKDTFLALVVGLPHGVMVMSQEIAGLVETSNNLAIVKTMTDKATAYTSTRSSIISALEATRQKIDAIGKLSGGSVEHLDGYPAWTPNLDSDILKVLKKTYKNVTGKEAKVMAIHAGLECGIIGEKFEGMDMISFGPDLNNPHSPDENVSIASVERFYNHLSATLAELA
ncbi:aminoacyl-histidine dipeptidase [candidate division KSB1 bacterium]|nr:aminoacyl-histidine dipeptidase [candidate division KSB1 bacterium]